MMKIKLFKKYNGQIKLKIIKIIRKNKLILFKFYKKIGINNINYSFNKKIYEKFIIQKS